MKLPPLFFLSFANNDHRPLPKLTEERQAIYDALSPAAHDQRIQLHQEPTARTTNVAKYLVTVPNRVHLFHYSGHAGSSHLIFKDQAANADGIAHLLAQQKNLKLVFLNGCSTFAQVALLLQLGIPAVIATNTLVDDTLAMEFASLFYQAIAEKQTLETAFEQAAAFVKTKSTFHPRIHYRDVFLRDSPKASEPLDWGLYVKDKAILKEVLLPPKAMTGKTRNIAEGVDIDVEEDIHIGDKNPDPNEKYDHKNILRNATVKSRKGGFRLGDGEKIY